MTRITNRAPFSFFLASVAVSVAGFSGAGEPVSVIVDEAQLSEGERSQLETWQRANVGVTMEPAPPGSVPTVTAVPPTPPAPPAPVPTIPAPPRPPTAPATPPGMFPAPPTIPAPAAPPAAPVQAPPAPPGMFPPPPAPPTLPQ